MRIFILALGAIIIFSSNCHAIVFCKRFPSDTPVPCYGPDYPPPGGSSTNVGIGTANRVVVYTGTSTAGPAANLYVVGNNVGIGSTNPGQALDVNGTVRATNFIGNGSSITNPIYATVNKLKRCIHEANLVNVRTSGTMALAKAPTITADGTTDITTSYYAYNLLTNDGTVVSNGDTVTIAGQVYTFQTSLTEANCNVKIVSGNATSTMTNLFHAINASGGTPGTDYANACVANTAVTATNPSTFTVLLTALVTGNGSGGTSGASTTTVKSSTHLTFQFSSTLSINKTDYTLNDNTTRASIFRIFGGTPVNFSSAYRIRATIVAATGGNISAGDGSQGTYARIEFMTDSLAPSIGVTPTTSAYRFIIDGQYVSTSGTVTSPTSGSSTAYLTLTFPSKTTHKIIIETQQAGGFIDVKVGPTEKAWQTDNNDIVHAVFLGDSYVQGSDATNLGDGVGVQLADYLGIRDMRNSGSGGTGWATGGGAYNFGTRISNGDIGYAITLGATSALATSMSATVPTTISTIPIGRYVTTAGHEFYINTQATVTSGVSTLSINSLPVAISVGEVAYLYGSAPDVVFLMASFNDRSNTAATVQANALAGMQAIRVFWPNALIFVFGACPANQYVSNSSGIYQNSELPVSNAVTAFNDPYTIFIPILSNINGPLYTGIGTVGAMVGTGNSDIYTNVDATHPQDPAGLQYIGRDIYATGIKTAIGTYVNN